MTQAQSKTPQIPPEVLNYMRGPTEECMQFDFLIGDWKVEGSRYAPNGETMQNYAGAWRAQYLHDKRMIMDDFTIHAPTGQEVSAFVTLRTYSPITKRWEMAGISAFQPAVNGKWYGNFADGEMHLTMEGLMPDGRSFRNRIRFHDIERDRFQWESLISHDEGKTWIKISSLVARRA
jgi:hypothetical protein